MQERPPLPDDPAPPTEPASAGNETDDDADGDSHGVSTPQDESDDDARDFPPEAVACARPSPTKAEGFLAQRRCYGNPSSVALCGLALLCGAAIAGRT